ncbi:MAG: M56 family metallopeptidase [Candidatus Bathyarchaeota archaeon]|nr:M56 family metallopeptidase [Candidatus Bathyarchaeum tardum]
MSFDEINHLSFTVLGHQHEAIFEVRITAKEIIKLEIIPVVEEVSEDLVNQVKKDIFVSIQLFEETVRKTTLYFAYVDGDEIKPEKEMQMKKSILGRIFSSGMYIFFIISITISIFLFLLFGFYAVIILIVLQFALFLFSDKLIAKAGDWQISAANPNVHLFQYHLPVDDYQKIKQRFSAQEFVTIKSEIYQKTLGLRKSLTCEIAHEVFSKYGITCYPQNMSTKKINVYQIVENVAKKFNAPIPKIVLANTTVPNAAATGPSPKRGVTLITTGLLVQLQEDEILNVIGHEFSHLVNRDPLILLGLTTSEYLLRIYLFLNLFTSFFWFAYIYLFLSLSSLYFIAKFFEGRADLDTAVKIGQPKVLAEALEKIGFSRLQFQDVSAYKVQSWIRWDPHPPIYFRIHRLMTIEDPKEIKHTLVRSIKDNFNGLWDAIRR